LIDIETAQRVILAACPVLPSAALPLGDALGRVPTSVVRVEVAAGQAVRIMTGAVVPAGADAIVMVERTSPASGGEGRVVIEVSASPGDHVRHPGEDLRAGQVIFEAGTELGPGHIGVLASVGVTAVGVVPPPRVGVLSTGDELVADGRALRPGQIRDSNRPMLLALLGRVGCVPIDLGTAPDDEDAIAAAIEGGVTACDAILTSGGVSVGDFDYVKAVLDRMGDMHWWQVAVRPAKPLAFGTVAGTPVFSRRLDGRLHLLCAVATLDGEGRWHVRSSGGQGSHLLRTMALANGLALLPDGDGMDQGASVQVLLLA